MTEQLDENSEARELLQKGIEASASSRSDDAITIWSSAIQKWPVFPQAHYLLAAELAHVQRYSEAVVQFTLAVEQAPELLPARVQLALLWLTLQSASQCEAVARPLLELPTDNAYHHIGAALTAVSRGDQPAAVEALRTVDTLPLDNAPLAADMKLLLNALLAQSASQPTAAASATESAREVDHLAAISLYSGRRH